jgi:plasmid stabilization system protein ParE
MHDTCQMVRPCDAANAAGATRPVARTDEETVMPRGDKSKYTNKQDRQAEHIEEGYEKRGVSKGEAERRAWATVNKMSGGGKKSGSGRGRKTNKAPARKGGKKGGASRKRSAAKKTGARKSAAKRSGGRKSTGRKSGARKSSGRKSGARKSGRKSTGRKSSARKGGRKSTGRTRKSS